MSQSQLPENFEIASLRRKQAEVFDPMLPGAGTPWEDRGAHGIIGAFFKTCLMSLYAPGRLFMAIRRPETTSDATGFVFGCGLLWATSVVIHGLILIPHFNGERYTQVQTSNYFTILVITAAAAFLGTWIGMKLYCAINGKMVGQEKQLGRITTPLVFNVNAYALGPSVLAIVPIIGPPLAIIWILIDFVIAGLKRLRIRFAGAMIDAIIPYIVVLALATVVYFAGWFLLPYFIGDPTIVTPPPKVGSAFGS